MLDLLDVLDYLDAIDILVLIIGDIDNIVPLSVSGMSSVEIPHLADVCSCMCEIIVVPL